MPSSIDAQPTSFTALDISMTRPFGSASAKGPTNGASTI
jgi:hypothetical protein